MAQYLSLRQLGPAVLVASISCRSRTPPSKPAASFRSNVQDACLGLHLDVLPDPLGSRLAAWVPIPLAGVQSVAPTVVWARQALAAVAAHITATALHMVEVINDAFYVIKAVQQVFTLERVASVIKSAGVMDMASCSVHFGRTRVTFSADDAPNHPNAKFFGAPVDVVMRALTVALFMREVGPRAQRIGELVPMRVEGLVRAADVAGQAVDERRDANCAGDVCNDAWLDGDQGGRVDRCLGTFCMAVCCQFGSDATRFVGAV